MSLSSGIRFSTSLPGREPRSDLELLRAAAAGDTAAFDLLFARHRDALRGFLYLKLRNHEEAEDAMLLTFANAWRSRATFRGETSGKAWLYQIATRVAIDALRRRQRAPKQELLDAALELSEPPGEPPADPMRELVERERETERREAVLHAMRGLPPEEFRLLRLFYFDGCSYEQIGSSLGVSRSQVRGRLYRIRARIRRHLAERGVWALG